MGKPNFDLLRRIQELADGSRSSVEIAAELGVAPRNVRKYLLRHNLPRLQEGSRAGAHNHQFVSGRRVSLRGYVAITPPIGHPTAKSRVGRKSTWIFEHRYALEQVLGRPLLPSERVDHVDGLTLHNSPDNLRLFPSNAEHLRATLSGKVPLWSPEGVRNMQLRHVQGVTLVPVDIHRQRTESGAVRLRQILLLALRLGIDSPYLLGTTLHTTKAGIDMCSRPTIERALVALCQRWGWDHPLLG
jgi:HNH endonuclease